MGNARGRPEAAVPVAGGKGTAMLLQTMTLGKRLTKMIHSLNHLLFNALRKAVGGFVNNGMRNQPHYRTGYDDGFFGRSAAEPPADNASQRRWYWTGVVLG